MFREWIHRVTGVREDEQDVVLLACVFFFCILSGYYVLRPLREEMGLAGGVENLPRLYLVNLGVMLALTPLFGALLKRFPRRRLVPAVYRFFMLCLLVFLGFALRLPDESQIGLGRVFYVGLSVFNMWAVSLFWATMADRIDLVRSKRLFGLIAVGGTLGGIAGAGATTLLVESVGRVKLVLVSVVMLELAVQAVNALWRRPSLRPTGGGATAPEPRGGVLSGLTAVVRSPYLTGIAGFIVLYSLSSTFLYFVQAQIVHDEAVERVARAALFARIDLWTNLLTLVLQLGLAGRLIPRIGVGATLMLLPLLTAAGFAVLAFAPTYGVVLIFQAVRRAGNYALARPARETLYTIVSVDEKYKAKSFIDTFVYRGGDAVGATVYNVLGRAGVGVAGVALTAFPLALIWGGVGVVLGAAQQRLANSRQETGS